MNVDIGGAILKLYISYNHRPSRWSVIEKNDIKGTISDRQFQTSLFSKPLDFFAYQRKLHCNSLPIQQLAQKQLKLERETILCCWELIIAGNN